MGPRRFERPTDDRDGVVIGGDSVVVESGVTEKKRSNSPVNEGPGEATLGETARSLWSVVLCAHLFAVAVALSSNLNRSPLQDRILNATGMRSYLQLFHWDSPYLVGYQLTHAMEAEDNHRLVVDPIAGANGTGDPGLVYPGDDLWPGGFRAQRVRNFLGRLAAFTEQDDGESLSECFGAVVGSLRGTGASSDGLASAEPNASPRMRVVRLERLTPLPLQQQPDEEMDERLEVFVGDAWRDAAGVMRVNRRVDRTDAALVSPQASAPAGATGDPQPAGPSSVRNP